jgi:hypothetical protein
MHGTRYVSMESAAHFDVRELSTIEKQNTNSSVFLEKIAHVLYFCI